MIRSQCAPFIRMNPPNSALKNIWKRCSAHQPPPSTRLILAGTEPRLLGRASQDVDGSERLVGTMALLVARYHIGFGHHARFGTRPATSEHFDSPPTTNQRKKRFPIRDSNGTPSGWPVGKRGHRQCVTYPRLEIKIVVCWKSPIFLRTRARQRFLCKPAQMFRNPNWASLGAQERQRFVSTFLPACHRFRPCWSLMH